VIGSVNNQIQQCFPEYHEYRVIF